jgi:hypothetical protein
MATRLASSMISHSNDYTGHSMPLVAHAQNLRSYCAKLKYNPQQIGLFRTFGDEMMSLFAAE